MAKRVTEWISVRQAAQRRDCSKHTILNAIKDGTLPAVKVDTFYVIDAKDLSKVQVDPNLGRPAAGR